MKPPRVDLPLVDELRLLRLIDHEIGFFQLCYLTPSSGLRRVSRAAWEALKRAARTCGYDSICEAVYLGALPEIVQGAVKSELERQRDEKRRAKRKAG